MIRSTENRWLHRFAILTALATLFLICLGGLVTSKGVGMSVPDWPTTYGYSMFFFPFSKWVGGIFYEHSHRLVASMVGFLTVALAVWLWLQEPRRWRNCFSCWFAPSRCSPRAGGLRRRRCRSATGAGCATCIKL